MEISEIYGKIFPMEIDDNNTYAELKGNELNVAQLLEPAISVSEMFEGQYIRTNSKAIPDRQTFRVPLVMVNDIYIDQEALTNFALDYSGFIPTVMIEFIDVRNEMLSITSMKDGSIIKVYVGGLGDESYYKPIRQDFIVTDIRKVGGRHQNKGDNMQYRISGKLNVPVGYKKESWSNFACTSIQELFNLSIELGLGFATNFDKETNDKMKWQNLPNTDYFDFIRDITSHSCYSPNTFFTSFIDQYYVLNFVECHALLSHGGEKTDVPAIIYKNIQEEQDTLDENGNKKFKYTSEDNLKDSEKKNRWGSRFNNPIQKLTYYYLSNNEFFKDWTNFIEEYIEINNGASSTNDGYRRNVGYNDYNAGDWGMSNVIFSIPPIDNLKRDSATQKIQEMSDDIKEDSYIPINLVHATQTVYQTEKNNETSSSANSSNATKASSNSQTDASKSATTATNKSTTTTASTGSSASKTAAVAVTEGTSSETAASTSNETTASAGSVDDMSGIESFSYYGGVDTTNMFKLYYFAKEQNSFQMNCMKKCGLKVKLQNYNPSITKFSRIWIDIYDKNSSSSYAISQQKYRSKSANANIITFDDEGVINTKAGGTNTSDNIKDSWAQSKYNRGLSGWYVVTELKYVYNKIDLRINTILTLNRIEKKPLFKQEYLIAKNAITKYAEDNIIEKLIKSNDDSSYASSNTAENTQATETTPETIDENASTELTDSTSTSTSTSKNKSKNINKSSSNTSLNNNSKHTSIDDKNYNQSNQMITDWFNKNTINGTIGKF